MYTIETLMAIKCLNKGERYTCLSVILLDSIFVNSDNKYYPQIFLNKCKYPIKKVMNTITEEVNSDKSDAESDNKFTLWWFTLSDHSLQK